MIKIAGADLRNRVAHRYAREFDNWDGEIVVSDEVIENAIKRVPQKNRDDILFAHDNIRRFAEAQKETVQDSEIEILPGLTAGQRQIPISTTGCYAPGGRYSHIASAIMTVTFARVAGVSHITAYSPPRPDVGIPPEILYTMNLCGVDTILNLGGVQGIAAMAFGLFGLPQWICLLVLAISLSQKQSEFFLGALVLT